VNARRHSFPEPLPRLRKAAARRLAEAGCTQHEIAAITGHASLKEIVRYTKAADQRRLATTAMKKMQAENETCSGSVNPPLSNPKRLSTRQQTS
jgi:hypothetical protein